MDHRERFIRKGSRRSLMVVAATSVTGTLLLVGLLIPYLSAPVYYVSITLEELNVICTFFDVGDDEVRSFLPDRMVSEATSSSVYMYVGLGRLSVGGNSYEYMFARFHVHVTAMVGAGPYAGGGGTPFNYYVLDFFSNSTELGELFKSYGFPHTYVKISYKRVSEGSMDRISLALTYPNGQPLLELVALTNKTGERFPSAPGMGGSGSGDKINLHHLNNNNLTFLHIASRAALSSFSISNQVNITFAENTTPWRYAGRTEYAIERPVILIINYRAIVGLLGWVIWK